MKSNSTSSHVTILTLQRRFYFIPIILMLATLSSPSFAKTCTLTIEAKSGPIKIYAEEANTDEERARGLMFRKKLDDNRGMLFIYSTPQILSFWMQHTLIPLDILFIDASKKIIDIQTMPPCHQLSCPIYQSNKPAQYALEINGGLSKKLTIAVNDDVTLSP